MRVSRATPRRNCYLGLVNLLTSDIRPGAWKFADVMAGWPDLHGGRRESDHSEQELIVPHGLRRFHYVSATALVFVQSVSAHAFNYLKAAETVTSFLRNSKTHPNELVAICGVS